jgi:hypothetical protein
VTPHLTALSALAVLAAGLAAGAVNSIVGSGSLITFPTLIALGYPPVLANVSNTVGLVPGSASAVVAYRPELVGQRDRLLRLGTASLLGGTTGALLLLALPGSVFEGVVPVLILAAAVLMAVQPRVGAWVAARGGHHPHGRLPLVLGVYLTGIYGGYFGAAQGVVLIALLATFLDDHLQRLNAAKNVLAMVVNGVAGVIFILVSHISWPVAGLIAAGSIVGGQLGGRFGRRLPAEVLRAVIVVGGVAVAAILAVRWW